jgi:hypothetical protein
LTILGTVGPEVATIGAGQLRWSPCQRARIERYLIL